MRPFAHDRLRLAGIVPEVGVFGQRVQFIQTGESVIEVKDASSADPMTFQWLLELM